MAEALPVSPVLVEALRAPVPPWLAQLEPAQRPVRQGLCPESLTARE
jgi:hypothetical protein